MADQQPDPLVALLDKSGLAKAQKAGLWDLYTAAKNTDDLTERLKSLQLPDTVKSDLWDLKANETRQSEDSTPPPTADEEKARSYGFKGHFEDRGPAGKIWIPDEGKPGSESNRRDVNLPLGLPPEAAALSGLAVGRAMLAPGLSVIGRAAAGAKATAGQALSYAKPIAKYEIVKHALDYVGVPSWLSDIGAVAVTLGRGGKGAATAAEAAPAVEAGVERGVMGTPRTAAMERMGFQKPTETPLSPLELTRKLKSDWQAMMAAKPSEAVTAATETAATAKPKLSVQEMDAGLKLLKAGIPPQQALDAVIKMRELMKTESFARLPK